MTRNESAGIVLLELMLVVAVVAVLVAAAMPYFSGVREDTRLTKAREDCEMLANACARFNGHELRPIERLEQLVPRYVNALEKLRDPWGKAFQLNAERAFVFSMGPDGKSPWDNEKGLRSIERSEERKILKATERDDIKASYVGELMLLNAKLETEIHESKFAEGRMDRLTLVFNKPVVLANLKDTLIEDTTNVLLTDEDMEAFNPGGGVLDWYYGIPSESRRMRKGTRIFEEGQELILSYNPDDSREIVIDIDRHDLNGIQPNGHYVNVAAGCSRFFYEFDSFDREKKIDPDYVAQAKPTGSPCKIIRE